MILCRGGGSIEDLWAFNDEAVARAIRACPVPVVCGVGHETDFTIADFAADVRAPTPTGAAELAAPNRTELRQLLAHSGHRLIRIGRRGLEDRMQRVDYLSRRVIHPGETGLRLRGVAPDIDAIARAWQDLGRRLRDGGRRALEAAVGMLARLDAHLKHLDPRQVLERGYSITETLDGTIVRNAGQLRTGQDVKITLARGWADARVRRTGG